jgi:uncharacterized protein with NRDE domain
MTNNIGKVKKHKKSFQHLSKKGSRIHRQEFIESYYINGVYNESGEQVIRSLNDSEKEFLNNYYKEFVHGTFNTDQESTKLFKKAKALSKKKENVKFFNENGFYPEDVQAAIEAFNKKSKSLGNMAYDFFEQREVNSDDYKRRYDIQNNVSKGLQLESFEDLQYVSNVEELDNTTIEDLITESEE